MKIEMLAPFFRIITLQSGPQDIQFSQGLLLKVGLLYVVTGLLTLIPGPSDFFTVVFLLALDLITLVLFLKFCLYTRNTLARFPQTFLACLGVGVIFQLIALPLIWYLQSHAGNAESPNVFAAMVYMLLLGWQVSVMAQILKHAMNLLLPLSLLLSFSYFIFVIFIGDQLLKLLATA